MVETHLLSDSHYQLFYLEEEAREAIKAHFENRRESGL